MKSELQLPFTNMSKQHGCKWAAGMPFLRNWAAGLLTSHFSSDAEHATVFVISNVLGVSATSLLVSVSLSPQDAATFKS